MLPRTRRLRRIAVVAAAAAALALGAYAFRIELRAASAWLRLARDHPELDLGRIARGARVAAVVAHADDECFLFAGTLARLAREREAEITLVVLSGKDAEGVQRSAEVLGLRATRVVPDVGKPSSAGPARLDPVVARVLDELDPDVVLTFGPEGITGHRDHQATGRSVWRWALRRGRGILLRAVLPRELAALVSDSREPGWGAGTVWRVPLGETGKLRSASADSYAAAQRANLARHERSANFFNTEFWTVEELGGPANAPILRDSASEPPIVADEALVVVHATKLWDLREQARPAIDALLERFAASGRPIALLVDPEYPFTYLARREGVAAYASAGGEHALRFDAPRIVIAGGSLESCLNRAVICALAPLLRGSRRELEIVLPANAIYSVVFGDESVGAVTLAERVRDSADGGRALVRSLAERWRSSGPLGPVPPLPDLSKDLEGWEIALALPGLEREVVREGGSRGRILLRLEAR